MRSAATLRPQPATAARRRSPSAGATASAVSRDPEDAGPADGPPSSASVRRWLRLLGEPDRIADTEQAAAAELSSYRFEPIPAIASFIPRPDISQLVTDALDKYGVVHAHGPAGIGKTSLVADLAATWASHRPVLWYHTREGVNDT